MTRMMGTPQIPSLSALPDGSDANDKSTKAEDDVRDRVRRRGGYGGG